MSTTRYYPVPPIVASLSLAKPAVLEASAGTGKTYSIEHLVVALLLETTAKLEQLLVVTFTERATAELRARIRDKIADVLASAAPTRPAGKAWTIDAEAEAKLTRALSSFDAAPIFTIHGFCKRVLADQAFLSGELFDQELVDAAAVFGRTFRAVLRRDCTDEASPARARLLRLYLLGGGVDDLEQLLFKAHKAHGDIEPAWDEAAWLAATRDLDDAACLASFAGQPVTLASAVVQSFLGAIRPRLEAEKAAQGMLDFDDMLARLHDRLHGDGGDALAGTLRRQYRYALIDEFQDTDPRQWTIFRKVFADPAQADDASAPRLFLIGDPKQAIYSFRGADVHTYLAARDELLARGAERAPITENYRSTGAMIAAYNAVFSTGLTAGAADPFFDGGITYAPRVTRGEPDLRVEGGDGRAPIVLLHDAASQRDGLDAGSAKRRLARRMAREIRDLLSLAAPLRYETKQGMKALTAGDVFILTRSNAESVLAARYLRREGVPYAFFKQEGLFQTPEASDIRDVLAAVAAPSDAALRLRAWGTPFFAVPWRSLPDCRELPGSHPLFATLLAWHELAKRERYHELFERMLNDSGLLRREVFFAESERARTNYEHIFEVLLQAAYERRRSLGELVRALTRWIHELESPGGDDGNVQRLETERDAVQIMTLHRSKGLEAAVVFLFGGLGASNRHDEVTVFHREIDGKPARRVYIGGRSKAEREERALAGEVHAVAAAEAAQEYQRLYYVGMTRAKVRLYLPYYAASPAVAGPYACVHDRLRRIVAEGESHDGVLRHAGGEFSLVTFDDAADLAPAAPPKNARLWDPPIDALAEPDSAAEAGAAAAAVGRLRVESFTSLRGAQVRREDPQGGEDETHGATIAIAPGELPPGTATGIFLHQALETVDPAGFAGHATAEAWLAAAPAERERLARLCAAFAVAEERQAHAFTLIHRAYTTPLPLPGGALPAMHAAAELARETDFLLPLPERGHPPLGTWGGRVRAQAGFLKGYIDVLFAHEGKIYFADWKSNLLDDYRPEAVARYVERAYALQGLLYSLGLVRLLGFDERGYEERFGGYAYLFLRGWDAAGNGVYVNRAPWSELMKFNESLGLGRRPLTTS